MGPHLCQHRLWPAWVLVSKTHLPLPCMGTFIMAAAAMETEHTVLGQDTSVPVLALPVLTWCPRSRIDA